jgi:GntR family transcriptional regulator
VTGLPLYMQLVNQIKEQITKGHFLPGDILPSEHELAAKYNTSRTTVRKSLSILFSEGYIIPVPGKGYFVKEPEVDSYTLYFSEKNCIENYSGETKLLEVSLVPTDQLPRQLADLKDSFVKIRWLLYVDKEPAAYDIKYLPYEKGKPIIEKEIRYATFPEMVAKHQSLFSIKKTLRISVPVVSREISNLLKLDTGESVLMIEQKIFSEQGKLIGYGQLFIRGNYCNLVATSSYLHE